LYAQFCNVNRKDDKMLKKIGRAELATLIHRSTVNGTDELSTSWNGYKGFIVACFQEHMNRMCVTRPVYGMEFPEDFNDRVQRSNISKECKDIILGRTKEWT